MKKIFPLFESLQNYKRSDLQGDLFAGLTVGVMLIPQGMAYALLAGLPPIYGLYASILPLFIYALWGTARQLSVGPMAMVSLLILSAVSQANPSSADQYLQYAILLAFMVGGIQLLMGLLRLGFLVNFLSRPVIVGFNTAAALIIALSQMKHLLAIQLSRGKTHEMLKGIAENWKEINIPSLVMGLSAIVLLIILKKINKRIPGPLIAVILGILLVFGTGMDTQGIQIIEEIPAGLPSPVMPLFSLQAFQVLLPSAIVIALVGFMQVIAVGKAIQDLHKSYEIAPNRELIALGLSNIGTAFLAGFPVTGSMSRSAVNSNAGAKTGLASIFAAILVILTLAFFTQYFYYLPYSILAALIITSVIGMIHVGEGRYLWKTNKKDFWLFITTVAATLFWGIEEGIMLGIALSLLIVLYNVSYPHVAQLGKVPGTREFRNLKRFDKLDSWEDILIMRFDEQLYFANLNYFKEKLAFFLQDNPNTQHIILDFKAINNMDSSAVHMMKALIKKYQNRGINFSFADVRGPVRDIMKKTEIMDVIGEDHIFLSVFEAYQAIRENKGFASHPYATQTFE